MSKTKMILAATGGLMGVVVLVLAFLVWNAFSAKTAAIEGDEEEGTDGLETVVAKAEELSRKPVYPCAASVTAVESNRNLIAVWSADAFKLVSRGDRVFDAKTTAAAFKAFIVGDAKRIAALPGAADGRIAKADFAFGPFKDYITEGKMPADNQLPELQRRWDDVVSVIETLSACGAAEITDVQVRESPRAEEPAKAGAGKKKAADKTRKTRNGKEAQDDAKKPAAGTYVFAFRAKPAAFVKVINALEVCERFTVVDDFSFTRPADAVADALGGDEKKADQRGRAPVRSGRRRGGRRGIAEEEKKPEEEQPRNRLVTDPAADEPLSVTMTVSVYDFHSLEDDEPAADAKKGVSK